MQTFDMEKSPVMSITFNPEEIALAVATADGRLRYYNLERYELVIKAYVLEIIGFRNLMLKVKKTLFNKYISALMLNISLLLVKKV